jgi:hypothetical protein
MGPSALAVSSRPRHDIVSSSFHFGLSLALDPSSPLTSPPSQCTAAPVSWPRCRRRIPSPRSLPNPLDLPRALSDHPRPPGTLSAPPRGFPNSPASSGSATMAELAPPRRPAINSPPRPRFSSPPSSPPSTPPPQALARVPELLSCHHRRHGRSGPPLKLA